jgi:transposase InsO family protein
MTIPPIQHLAADLRSPAIYKWHKKFWTSHPLQAWVETPHTRKIVVWSMRQTLRTETALGALNMAVERQRPAPGLIHRRPRHPT